MPNYRFLRSLPAFLFILSFSDASKVQAQGAKLTTPDAPIADSDADHVKECSQWFFRGRLVLGKPSAELRRRPYLAKLRMRAQHASALAAARAMGQAAASSAVPWTPLGPVPLASDATGNGTQNYNQVWHTASALRSQIHPETPATLSSFRSTSSKTSPFIRRLPAKP